MFDAIITGWTLDEEGRIHGQIIADAKGRFKDGLQIVTSVVQHIERIEGLAIAVTRNSRYALGA